MGLRRCSWLFENLLDSLLSPLKAYSGGMGVGYGPITLGIELKLRKNNDANLGIALTNQRLRFIGQLKRILRLPRGVTQRVNLN